MKNLPSRTPLRNLTDDQKDIWLGLVLILIIASMYYFQWAYYLTGLEDSKVNIDQPERYFWWANDSRSYRDAGDWLFGRNDGTSISRRPWLYPLLLGLSRTLFIDSAERVVWFLQFFMWLVSGALIYLSLKKATRTVVFGMVGAVFFFSHPSPVILTFHGMTETLNIFLISVFSWLLTTKRKNRMYTAVALIALSTVTKPIYLMFLVLLTIYVFARYSRTTRFKQASVVALLLLPIWIQLLLSIIASGTPTLSTIGSYTFKNYLVADVYMRTEGTEWRETTALIEDWDIPQQLSYLWGHQRTTFLTIRSHLIDSNLWVGSFFTLGEGNRMEGLALSMNAFAAYLHLLMLPLVLYYLLSKKYTAHKEAIALLFFCFLLQFLSSAISSGQDDRLMITALPLWIISYSLCLYGFASRQSDLAAGKTSSLVPS
jgi:hypothetical protein